MRDAPSDVVLAGEDGATNSCGSFWLREVFHEIRRLMLGGLRHCQQSHICHRKDRCIVNTLFSMKSAERLPLGCKRYGMLAISAGTAWIEKPSAARRPVAASIVSAAILAHRVPSARGAWDTKVPLMAPKSEVQPQMRAEHFSAEKHALCGNPLSFHLTGHVEAEAASALRSSAAVVLVDGALDTYPIVAVNAAFEALTGFSSWELANSPFFSAKNLEKDENSKAALRSLMAAGQEGAVQTVAYRKDGTGFPCAIFLRPLIDLNSVAICHLATILPFEASPGTGDVALISSDQVIEFLATMAHELRNPMTPILGNVQMMRKLLQDGETGPRMMRLLERLELAVEVFSRRATLLMEVSRIASGGLKLKPEPLDLFQLTSEGVARHRGVADALSVPLHLEDGKPVIGLFDRVAIEQILDNLISNALKFSDEKPIAISVGTNGDFAILEVKDNGVGIPADKLEGIFNFFEQGSLPMRSGGFGIGLWVVRHLVKAMDGTITVDSVIDRGSVFMVKIPLRPRI